MTKKEIDQYSNKPASLWYMSALVPIIGSLYIWNKHDQ